METVGGVGERQKQGVIIRVQLKSLPGEFHSVLWFIHQPLKTRLNKHIYDVSCFSYANLGQKISRKAKSR